MNNMEALFEKLRSPEIDARPVQILHHHYPKDARAQEAFLDEAVSKGMGGFCVNMDIEGDPNGYLLEDTPDAEAEWQSLCGFVDGCFRRKLCVWIYDERKFPSGAANDLVIKKLPDAQVKGLILHSRIMDGTTDTLRKDTRDLRHAKAYPVENGRILLNEGISAKTAGNDLLFCVPGDGREYRMCAVYTGPVQFITQNGVPYADLLKKDVTDAFLSVTHERYLKHLGQERISRITAFFTDEPGLPVHGCSNVFDESGAVAAWTEEMDALLPEFSKEKYLSIFLDTDGEDATIRMEYWTQIQKLFSENYFKRIYDWCDRNGTRFTGHMYGEETLSMQIGLNAGLFSLMRYMQMPGVDRLYCANPRDVIAEKTASSCMHLMGRDMTMSENSFHLEENFWKLQSETTNENRLNSWYYQAQLGITNAASYFAYDGDSERKTYEEKCGRASGFVRLGTHRTDVLVMIPMRAAFERYKAPFEKYWLVGPCTVAPGQDEDMRTLENAYGEALLRLEDELFDFDLIDEEGLDACRVQDGKLCTDTECFSHLVVFDSDTWKDEIVQKIRLFLRSGGAVSIVSVSGMSRLAENLKREFPDAVLFTSPEEIADSLVNAKRLLEKETEKGIRVRKSEYCGRGLYFIHNRTAEEKRACLAKGDYRVFDTCGNEIDFVGGAITVPAKEALMAIAIA